MKTTIKLPIIAFFSFLTVLTSCSSDNENTSKELLTDAEIPIAIKAYVETHFITNEIIRAEKETESGSITFAIYLTENVNLEFNSALLITNIDGVTELPNSVIPQTILDYVAANYPANFITDWDLETNYQEVELNNNLELEFDLNGNFIRVDDGYNSNDILLTDAEIPLAIKTYISTYFPTNTIIRAEKEKDLTVITYEIYLTRGLKLEFNSAFTIIDIDGIAQLPNTVIPKSLLDYVAANYPTNFITDWELELNYQEIKALRLN
ncbi:hypothetical protein RCH18_002508 [Flavobacterium sp. PL11]|uniref:PepSY-like domain-containing protein n=1 Tax=Flavobacterium sp. PL11 TaxID=3071717 RepID=UPI002DFA9BE9|nr:hypothetical protein [Flavobacterium sp. PL11]